LPCPCEEPEGDLKGLRMTGTDILFGRFPSWIFKIAYSVESLQDVVTQGKKRG